MSSWWTALPRGRVVALDGVDADALSVALDPLPADAPVVVTYRPRSLSSQAAIVDEVLRRLEASAIDLYPAWLPDASGIAGAGGANVPAVRALAARLAGATFHFGPFLADLAARALTGSAVVAPFPPEVRAAGLARVLEAAYDRADVVLLLELREPLTARNEAILRSATEWLAFHGSFGGIWLVGAELRSADWLLHRTVRLSANKVSPSGTPVDPSLPDLVVPPLAGQPAPQSEAEHKLENALATREWAYGRAWNQTFDLGTLTNSIRVDLLWAAERTVVEVDGPDHREKVKYAADRVRDVHLQTAGYAVLRFTNDQVIDDVNQVVHRIEQFLFTRRVP